MPWPSWFLRPEMLQPTRRSCSPSARPGLGHFKTPSRIHFLKELPKGPSGKVQRLRLLDPAVLAAVAATTQPESEAVTINSSGGGSNRISRLRTPSIEQIIAAAWARSLPCRRSTRETNFFALGGHSLLAIQCLSKLREKLPIVLSLADFFEFSTVAEQAELVRQRLRPANGTGGHEIADQSTIGNKRCCNSMCRQAADVIPRLNSLASPPAQPGPAAALVHGAIESGCARL